MDEPNRVESKIEREVEGNRVEWNRELEEENRCIRTHMWVNGQYIGSATEPVVSMYTWKDAKVKALTKLYKRYKRDNGRKEDLSEV